jgi:histidine triad (HIT) family protein
MESSVTSCIFCDIIEGRLSRSTVYEDDVVIAIMDTQPVNQGHVLVMPKKHAAFMADMDEQTGAHLFRVTMRVAQALYTSGLRCEGINLFLADGEAAFQEILHVHMHVFPRFKGDSYKIEADWSHQPSREELDALAERICAAYPRSGVGTEPLQPEA